MSLSFFVIIFHTVCQLFIPKLENFPTTPPATSTSITFSHIAFAPPLPVTLAVNIPPTLSPFRLLTPKSRYSNYGSCKFFLTFALILCTNEFGPSIARPPFAFIGLTTTTSGSVHSTMLWDAIGTNATGEASKTMSTHVIVQHCCPPCSLRP
ncbi:hypothetical protein HYC85_032069 [Camellia sinensis]|uniref:Uncharacterized protein n=1 Tax=Camellia sinensis TaxID=4442 RepID=A0A7J7FW41_CAMSI|nr:hypothetical protein HYC85_032069 [Camellia sinensis]